MKPILSLTPRPTLLALPSLARASATLSRTTFSAALIALISAESSKVSELLAVSSCINSEFLVYLVGAREVLWMLSAILTRIQCVGLLFRFHKKEKYVPGTGVVISAGVYLRLMGNIFDVRGAVSRDPLNGRIPRPLVVVHSGNTAMERFGFSWTKASRSVRPALDAGFSLGGQKA